MGHTQPIPPTRTPDIPVHEPHERSDAFGRIEETGVEHIADADRTSSPANLFAVFLGGNLALSVIVFGWIPVTLGLSCEAAVASSAVGLALGLVVTAPLALLGPRTGTNNTVSSGAHFGIRGRLIGSTLTLLFAVGYGVITSEIVAVALFGHGTVVALQKVLLPVVGWTAAGLFLSLSANSVFGAFTAKALPLDAASYVARLVDAAPDWYVLTLLLVALAWNAVDAITAMTLVRNGLAGPWVAVLLLGFLGRDTAYDPDDLQAFAQGRRGGRYRFTAGSVFGLLSVATSLYVGPLADLAGGIDVSVVGSMIVAAAVYLVLAKLGPPPTPTPPPVASSVASSVEQSRPVHEEVAP